MSNKDLLLDALEFEKWKQNLLSFLDNTQELDLGFGKATFRKEDILTDFSLLSIRFLAVPVHVVTMKSEYHLNASLVPFQITKKMTKVDVAERLVKWLTDSFHSHKSSDFKAYYHCTLCDGALKKQDKETYPSIVQLTDVLNHKKLVLESLNDSDDNSDTVRNVVGHIASMLNKVYKIAAEVPNSVVEELREFVQHIPKKYFGSHFVESAEGVAFIAYKEHPYATPKYGLSSFMVEQKNGRYARVNRQHSKLYQLTPHKH